MKSRRARKAEKPAVPTDSDFPQRLPPSDVPAEQALLGTLLANNKVYDRITVPLAPEHFADPVNGRIFQSIARGIESGQLVHALTLKAEFEHTDALEQIGGTAYLGLLLTAGTTIINVAECGCRIYDSWLRREIIDIGQTMVNSAFDLDTGTDGTAQIEAAEQRLFQLTTTEGDGNVAIPFERALTDAIMDAERVFRRQGSIAGLTTGLQGMDALTGGLHRSDLIIVAGRPGMGKTALALKIASSAATSLLNDATETAQKPCVAVFSLETSANQVALRLLSSQSDISAQRIRRGDISAADFTRFVTVTRDLNRLPLVIDGRSAMTIETLRTRCRWLARTQGLALVVVDYLQLIRPRNGVHVGTRTDEIGRITRDLKALAMELNVPVLAVSQLSRNVEDRQNKRPRLDDLRQSGTIEDDADCVIFIYREVYYHAHLEPDKMDFASDDEYRTKRQLWIRLMNQGYGKAELIIAKQRLGPTGSVLCQFDAEHARFADLPVDGGSRAVSTA